MRASIARLILSNASLCLLDEPTSNLDTKGKDFVNFWIDRHIKNGGMCILATHQSSPIKSSIKEIVLS
jgi:heme exporter protein A